MRFLEVGGDTAALPISKSDRVGSFRASNLRRRGVFYECLRFPARFGLGERPAGLWREWLGHILVFGTIRDSGHDLAPVGLEYECHWGSGLNEPRYSPYIGT